MKGGAFVVLATLLLPAASLAGQGWYLITPPVSEYPTESTNGQVDGSAPLAKWGQSAAFDTAQECERERNAKTTKAWDTLKGLQTQERENILVKLQKLLNTSVLVGRCIASDDPRLKQ